MIAMQYRFDFPDGTDMAPIHRRVAEKGPGFDGLPGLEHKAFLVSDQAQAPATYANKYRLPCSPTRGCIRRWSPSTRNAWPSPVLCSGTPSLHPGRASMSGTCPTWRPA
jgi:hypothetical protein